MDIVVRQAHPGPGVPPYRSMDDKWRDAIRYKEEEGIPWTVAVDDLEGSTHQVYGGMADPTYLIDVDGRVAFFNIWTYAPALDSALRELLERGGRGKVSGAIDHVPHMGPALTDGWRGLQRGLPQSYFDMETSAPGAAAGLWLGYQARPLLAPLTLRAEPLPVMTRVALGVGAVGLGLLAGYLINRQRSQGGRSDA